ncbi:hypothetical protein H4R33_006465 [Dimargaris cristalligena]|nr:hypothetical protein H4R33_006465 [Dimargaris cristalligena]
MDNPPMWSADDDISFEHLMSASEEEFDLSAETPDLELLMSIDQPILSPRPFPTTFAIQSSEAPQSPLSLAPTTTISPLVRLIATPASPKTTTLFATDVSRSPDQTEEIQPTEGATAPAFAHSPDETAQPPGPPWSTPLPTAILPSIIGREDLGPTPADLGPSQTSPNLDPRTPVFQPHVQSSTLFTPLALKNQPSNISLRSNDSFTPLRSYLLPPPVSQSVEELKSRVRQVLDRAELKKKDSLEFFAKLKREPGAADSLGEIFLSPKHGLSQMATVIPTNQYLDTPIRMVQTGSSDEVSPFGAPGSPILLSPSYGHVNPTALTLGSPRSDNEADSPLMAGSILFRPGPTSPPSDGLLSFPPLSSPSPMFLNSADSSFDHNPNSDPVIAFLPATSTPITMTAHTSGSATATVSPAVGGGSLKPPRPPALQPRIVGRIFSVIDGSAPIDRRSVLVQRREPRSESWSLDTILHPTMQQLDAGTCTLVSPDEPTQMPDPAAWSLLTQYTPAFARILKSQAQLRGRRRNHPYQHQLDRPELTNHKSRLSRVAKRPYPPPPSQLRAPSPPIPAAKRNSMPASAASRRPPSMSSPTTVGERRQARTTRPVSLLALPVTRVSPDRKVITRPLSALAYRSPSLHPSIGQRLASCSWPASQLPKPLSASSPASGAVTRRHSQLLASSATPFYSGPAVSASPNSLTVPKYATLPRAAGLPAAVRNPTPLTTNTAHGRGLLADHTIPEGTNKPLSPTDVHRQRSRFGYGSFEDFFNQYRNRRAEKTNGYTT